jgi:hypothetical protein
MRRLRFVIDFGKIGKELIDSEGLVQNKIEPYYSLSCFHAMGYDLKSCLEICPRSPICITRFLLGNYVLIKEREVNEKHSDGKIF